MILTSKLAWKGEVRVDVEASAQCPAQSEFARQKLP